MTKEELLKLKERGGTYRVKDVASKKTVRIYVNSKVTNIFEFNPGSTKYGRYIPEETALIKYELTSALKNPTETWHKRLRRAISMMETSGLYPEIKNIYNNLLTMTSEDHASLCALWDEELSFNRKMSQDKVSEEAKRLRAIYPFAFLSDGRVNSDYINELTNCELKSMYFGKYGSYEKERVRNALKNGVKVHFTFDDGSYDCYFSYDPGKSAVYAQEYRGTGNGHYYLALNETHCVFYEND